jgi:hypothetical protein
MMNPNERIALVTSKLRQTTFYRMPASAVHHCNHQGGLLEHSTDVWLNLQNLTEQLGLKWQDPSSPFIIGMLHDACMIDAYMYNPDYDAWDLKVREARYLSLSHAELSLAIIEELGIELTDEEKACIRWHMGAWEGNWSEFTDAIHQYPNVLWVHTADMMATHIDEYNAEKWIPKPIQVNQTNNMRG